MLAKFIHAQQWKLRIVGATIDLKDIFHGSDESCVLFGWNTPAFLSPGLQFAFFKIRRTDSLEIESMISSSTAFSASKFNVHRLLPSGAWKQANCVIRASTSPVILRGFGGVSRFLRSNGPGGQLHNNAFAVFVSVEARCFQLRQLERPPSQDQIHFHRIKVVLWPCGAFQRKLSLSSGLILAHFVRLMSV